MPAIQILIFRGTGGVQNKNHPYYSEPALVRAGHVGMMGVIENKIIGFHPTPEATATIGGVDALIQALSNREAIAGCLQDDNTYFQRAYELIEETEGRTTVYTYTVEISNETLENIRSWYNNKREALYSFPDKSGQFADDEYNCAMFLKVFNIPLPARTGNLKALTDKMKAEGYDQWHPKDIF